MKILWGSLTAGVILLSLVGCKETRTAGKEIYEPAVETVTCYGVQLGPGAPPEDVVYVLLQAVAEKRQAVLDSDDQAKENATRTLVSLAAPEKIMEEFRKRFPSGKGAAFRPAVRINEMARSWGPALAHYTGCFVKDHDALVAKMTRIPQSESQVTVSFPVHEDRYQSSALLLVRLIKEKGYWRIWKLEYTRAKAVVGRPSSGPAGTATKPATRSALN